MSELEAGRLTVEGALLHLGDVTRMLREVDRFTNLSIPQSVFENLVSVTAALEMVNAERLTCHRCHRERPTSALEPTTEGLFKCTPGADGYDECMRIYNTV